MSPRLLPAALLAACLIGPAAPCGGGFLPVGFAQEDPPAPPVEEPIEGPDESLSGQAIEVAPETEDAAIAKRLERILRLLEEVGWVENPSVQVEEGIVTLRGVAESPERRRLIGDLARNVRDVAVVINALTVAAPDPFDLSRILATLRGLIADLAEAVPYLLFALVVLLLTWPAARAARWFARIVLGPRIDNPLLETVAVRTAAAAVVIGGVSLILSVCGLTGLAAGVLGGAGLGGLVIGFAFRNIAENFLASILLSMSQPFRAGDVVEIDGETGVVQKVTTRGTWLMSFDGNHIQIPNGTVYTSVIRNLTANPNVRLHFAVGIDYGDGAATAQAVIMDALQSHPATLNDPEPLVLLDELGASTVNLKVYFWCDGVRNSGLKVRSSVIRRVKRAIEAAGLTMPDEAREVIFPRGVPLTGSLAALTDGDDAEPPDVPPPPPPRPTPAAEPVVSEAEGDLSSDTEELTEQARRGRDPDAARDLLAPAPAVSTAPAAAPPSA